MAAPSEPGRSFVQEVATAISRLLWNTSVDEAEELCRDFQVRGMWIAGFRAEASLWRALISDIAQQLEEALTKLDAAEALANEDYKRYNSRENLVVSTLKKGVSVVWSSNAPQLTAAEMEDAARKHKRFIESVVVLAEIELGRTTILFRQNSYVRGGYHLRKSWKYYEEAQKELVALDKHLAAVLANNKDGGTAASIVDPPETALDSMPLATLHGHVQFGVGLFHLMISMVPKKFLFLVEAIGFEADRQHAAGELLACWEVGARCTRAPLAAVILSYMYTFLDERQDEATYLLGSLKQLLPESPLVQMSHAFMLRNQGHNAEAKTAFQAALRLCGDSPTVKQVRLVAEYEYGHCLFLECKWAEVIPIIERYLQESTSRNFRAYGAYKLGFCYHMTGKQELIRPLYDKVAGWVRPNFSFDKYAARQAQRWSKRGGYSKFDELFISANCLQEGKQHEAALRVLESEMVPLLKRDKSLGKECHALFYYLKGCALKSLGQRDKAIAYYKKVLGFGPEAVGDELYVLPHSYVGLCEIVLEQWKDTQKQQSEASSLKEQEENLVIAEDLLRSAKSFSEYDFDRPMNVRLVKASDAVSKALRQTRTALKKK